MGLVSINEEGDVKLAASVSSLSTKIKIKAKIKSDSK